MEKGLGVSQRSWKSMNMDQLEREGCSGGVYVGVYVDS